MQTVVRFAPSPTGLLHVGNARVALINRLFAYNGHFILRFDDTDKIRSYEHYVSSIKSDLSWLGIQWEEEVKQSERFELYNATMHRLRSAGRIYPCYETVKELEYQRQAQLEKGQPPFYNRAALELSEIERARFEANGRKPYWRFLLHPHNMQWIDLVRGPCNYHGIYLSDPIIQREDGTYLYMLPSVVDDIALSVTHVIRGDDHITNTAIQMQLFQALLAPIPSFAHLPLMSGANGEELSKRLGTLSIYSLRKDGIEPMALASLLATTGTEKSTYLRLSISELAKEFSIKQYKRSTARFDLDRLWRMNSRLLHETSFSSIQKHFIELGLTTATEEFWHAIRPNLNSLEDIRTWWNICTAPALPLSILLTRDNVAFYSTAIRLLPFEPWDELTWLIWTNALEITIGCARKSLLQSLRLALTRKTYGPDLKKLLPIIGRSRVIARLRNCTLEEIYSSTNGSHENWRPLIPYVKETVRQGSNEELNSKYSFSQY